MSVFWNARRNRSARKGETVVGAAGFGLGFAAAAGGDDDVLAIVDFERGGRGVAAGFHLELPKELAGFFVVGVVAFVHGGADEDESPGGDEGAADVEGAGGRE